MNAKNAFSVDLDCLDSIKDFVQTQNADKKWVRTGEAIDAGAKVYGFRVDNVHHSAYRMLNTIARTGNEQLEVISEGEDSEQGVDAESKKKTKKKTKSRRMMTSSGGEKTLEKEANLNISSYDSMVISQIDPLFKKTTQRFDEMSMSTLMSGTLDTTPNLLMQLDSHLSGQGKLKDSQTIQKQNGPNSSSKEALDRIQKSLDLGTVYQQHAREKYISNIQMDYIELVRQESLMDDQQEADRPPVVYEEIQEEAAPEYNLQDDGVENGNPFS